jgi:predicted enzyme related to lactoylglutathione lyase
MQILHADIKYVHTNLIARDWKNLVRFYVKVFGCKPEPPERDLKGDWLDGLTSLKNVQVNGMHLYLPGFDNSGPTLEIFQYSKTRNQRTPELNQPGFAHIAFAVRNVKQMLSKVKRNGGSSVGNLVSTTIEGVGRINVVYARDPEGNIIELQKWD